MSSPLQVMQNCVSAFLRGLMNEKSIPVEIIGKCQMFEYLSRKSEFIQLERYCKSLGLFQKESTVDCAFKKYAELQEDIKMQEKCQSMESSLEQISNSVSTTLFDGSSHNSTSPCLLRNENTKPRSNCSQDSSIKDISLVFANSIIKDPLSNLQPISVLFQQSSNNLQNKEIISTQPLNIMKAESSYTYQNLVQLPQQFQLNIPHQAQLPSNNTIYNPKTASYSPSQICHSHRAGSCQIDSSTFNSPQERFLADDSRINNRPQKVKQFSLDPKQYTSIDCNSNNILNKHLVNVLPYQNSKPGYQANTIKPINFKMTMINAKDYSNFGGSVIKDAGSSHNHKNTFISPLSCLVINQTNGNQIKQNSYNPFSMISQIKMALIEFKEHTNSLDSSNMSSNQSQQHNYNNLSQQPLKNNNNPSQLTNFFPTDGFKTHSVDSQRKSYQLKKLSIYQQTAFTPIQLQQTQY